MLQDLILAAVNGAIKLADDETNKAMSKLQGGMGGFPACSEMKTPWTDSVDINAPLPEYPRPQMARRSWLNLNGPWLYAFTDSSRRTG